MLRIGINGLGRIGRCVFRAVFEEGYADRITIAAVNGPAPAQTHRHLLQYDSVHGKFIKQVETDGEFLICDGQRIPVFHERDPSNIDWSATGADIVFECTGHFTDAGDAAAHLRSGAKKVLISAPAKGEIPTIVYGVNHAILQPGDSIVSVGSCTTNCLAPVAHVLHNAFGIAQGFMTTIHAYTGDQNLLDGSHRDLRRARAAGLSIVPASTGAAGAIGLVLPELAGRLGGTSLRVPVPNVSMIDLTFTSHKPLSRDSIHRAMEQAATGPLSGVLAVNTEPLVSVDFTHHPASSIFDATGTQIMGEHFARVAAWYDNEWGFSCRMLDVALAMG